MELNLSLEGSPLNKVTHRSHKVIFRYKQSSVPERAEQMQELRGRDHKTTLTRIMLKC